MTAFRILLGALLCLVSFQVHAATTLLPPGMQCFTDANGPVAAGSVNMFYPSTTTPKPTWLDANQNALNTQPIQLDSNGCATIYGIGSYRQQLYDGPVVSGAPTGNLIFDKITTDTSAYNSVFWAATAGGTPNVITIIDTGFNATDGTVINFTALATNTGSATINPSSFGAIAVLKDTTAGPVSLSGGEIIQNNIISVVYRAQDNAFHLLNPPIQSASGAAAPLCGASGLKVTNGTSASSTIAITANSSVMVSSAGQVINRSNVSVLANITIGTSSPTINGMDGETPSASSWVYVWLIDNGSSTASLVSNAGGNGLAPNLPSGYVYKCLVGSMRVDGSVNLLRTIQYGNIAQYVVTPSTNTPALPVISSGSTSSSWNAEAVAAFVPPIAVGINVSLYASYGDPGGAAGVAPNANYSVITSTGTISSPVAPLAFNASTGVTAQGKAFVATANLRLESGSIYYLSNLSASTLSCIGFTIGGVNAN